MYQALRELFSKRDPPSADLRTCVSAGRRYLRMKPHTDCGQGRSKIQRDDNPIKDFGVFSSNCCPPFSELISRTLEQQGTGESIRYSA